MVGATGIATVSNRPIYVIALGRCPARTSSASNQFIFVCHGLKESIDATASSKDFQDVSTQVALNYRLKSDRVPQVYQDLRQEWAPRIVDPAIQEAVKASTARYSAGQLITMRQTVREGIQNALRARLEAHNISIDTMSITDFKFSRSSQTRLNRRSS